MGEEKSAEQNINFISDVEMLHDTELYRLLESDICIIRSFFELGEEETSTSCVERKAFIENFKRYIDQKKDIGYRYIFRLLSCFFHGRPKLVSLFEPLLKIALGFYTDQKEEINFFIHCKLYQQKLKFCAFDLLQDFDYDKFCSEETNYFDINPTEDENNIISIIYHDDTDSLINYLSENITFDIAKDIEITKNIDYISYFNLYCLQQTEISLINACCLFGSVKCFKYFLLNNCPLKNTGPYSIISGNMEIIHILQQKGVDFSGCFNICIEYHRYAICDWILFNYGWKAAPLSLCLTHFNFEAFLLNIYNGVPLSDADLNNKNALHVCSEMGITQLCDYLISHANIIESIDSKNLKPIHYACKNGNYDIAIKLIDKDCDLQSKSNYSDYPLHLACNECSLQIVQLLVSKGVNIEAKNISMQTPLHVACMRGYLPIVEYLIDNGCDIEARNKYERSALHFACEAGHLNIVQFLIQHHCEKEPSDKFGETPLHYACKRGSLPIVKYLVSQGCKIQPLDTFLRTPLHLACVYNHFSIIEYMISNGCNKECLDEHKYTPLHYACVGGNIDIVKYLLSQGCNKNPIDNQSHTPLYYANSKRFTHIVEYMKSHGCTM